jgi:PAS domain S-box-containing protein
VPFPLVVLIDSSNTNLKILERLVSSLGTGAGARAFRSAPAGIEYCRGHPPDLVVMAGETADGEAAEHIPALHALPGCGDVPVIVVAPYEDRDCIGRALAAGAADHLLSPIDHDEFRTRIGNLLRLRRLSASSAQPVEQEPPAARTDRQPAPILSEAHERLLHVLDAIPAMVCATDRDGRYVFVNREFAAFVGKRARQLVGRRPSEVCEDEFARRLAEEDQRLLAGMILPAAYEEEVDTPEGKRVLLTTKSLYRGDDGDTPMVVTVALDITARKRAETEAFAAREQAEIANRSKTEFLANMSHELRTPLNAIIGFSQVMASEMLGPITTPKYVGYARDILASAEHLLGIINDILDASKLEAGTLELDEEPVDVAKAVADLLELVEPKARPAEVRFSVRREGAIPLLTADPRKLKQIILNLLTNAIKFSHPGGEIEIVLRHDEGAVSIAVSDRGIGMDAAEVAVAMTRFGQVASAWSRRHPGTGLGLPLAIGLVELHGGTLDIRSVKDAGTTVTVTFPPERSAPPQALAAATGRISRRV